MDVRIEGQYSSREAMKLAHIVIQCLSERPKIEEIVRSLEQLQDSKDNQPSKQMVIISFLKQQWLRTTWKNSLNL